MMRMTKVLGAAAALGLLAGCAYDGGYGYRGASYAYEPYPYDPFYDGYGYYPSLGLGFTYLDRDRGYRGRRFDRDRGFREGRGRRFEGRGRRGGEGRGGGFRGGSRDGVGERGIAGGGLAVPKG